MTKTQTIHTDHPRHLLWQYLVVILFMLGLSPAVLAAPEDDVRTIEQQIAAGSDDAEERANGRMYLSSSDLELVHDGSDQVVGIRFRDVAIPHGATILQAHVQFQVDETTSGTTTLTIHGEARDHAATFTSTSGNISSRPRTAAAVTWSPPAWSTVGAAGAEQQTPNLADLIQEIVDRSGWTSGNALALILTGSGDRVAEAYEGNASAAPLLYVEYMSTEEPQLPTSKPPVAASCLDGSVEVLSGIYDAEYRSSGSAETTFDARDALFANDEQYPVLIENGACFVGGTILGQFDNDGSWDYYKEAVSGSAFRVELDQQAPFIVDGLYIDNHRDGIRIAKNVQHFVIRHVYMTNIHDDCVENDYYYTGVVEDVLLDGCYVAFSARGDSDRVEGRFHEVWTIRNALVRKQAFNEPYSGPSPGHGPTFKLSSDGDSPKIALHNTIFRIDQPASHGADMFPEDRIRIESCSNNILVWLGEGDFPGYLGKDPSTGRPCFTVTKDVSVWNRARQDWLERHGIDTPIDIQ